MSAPPINIADAVANPRLKDGQAISVNVGELRKLVALAEQAQANETRIARLEDGLVESVKRSLHVERYAEYDGVAD